MNLRLPVLTLLAFSFPIAVHAQSLGEVAREVRVEKQQSGTPHARVITNEDFETPAPVEATPAAADDAITKEATGKEGADAAKPAATEGAKQAVEASPEAAKDKHVTAKKRDPDKEREERELETQKRSEEINKHYLDRIASLHEQINTAQLLLVKLQTQQTEFTNEFRRTAAMSPTYAEFYTKTKEFNEQIDVQKNLILSLNEQLEDAREAARHAGVPHASDY